MKCEKCPADSALGCTAGVKPYQLRSGDTGCAWNLRIIKKHMKQSKPTNYDSIVRKTPEELADYFSELTCFPGANRDICKGVANCMD